MLVPVALFGPAFLFFFGTGSVEEAPTAPAPNASSSVRVSAPDVIWIPSGAYVRGSDERDVLFAVELCTLANVGFPRFDCTPESVRGRDPAAARVDLGVRHRPDRGDPGCLAPLHRAGVCAPAHASDADQRLAHPTHPVTTIDFPSASRFCAWVGGRLPTEAEWERAARGTDHRRFPWGNQYNSRLANHGRGAGPDDEDGYRLLAPVGSYPDAASPFGVLDMAGNVFEWTADAFSPEAYLTSSRVDPHGGESTGIRVVRGGSFLSAAFAMRTSHREPVPEGAIQPDLGFRCAYDP